MSDYGSTPPPPPPPLQGGGYGTPQVAIGGLASWIQRVLAYLIDYAIVLPFGILQFVFSPKTVTTTVNGDVNTASTSGNIGIALLMGLIVLGIWGYNRWFMGGKGASLGKRVVGLTLIAEQTGQPIGAGKAFLRDLAHIVDSIICYVGWLFPLWDAKRQTISDKIVGTVVTAKA